MPDILDLKEQIIQVKQEIKHLQNPKLKLSMRKWLKYRK